MKIEQLQNGHYRIRQQYRGKRISINFDHKPTQKECTMAMSKRMAELDDSMPLEGTLDDYSEKYLSLCENASKSPTTLRGYMSIKRNTQPWLLSTIMDRVDSTIMQKAVDEYQKTHSGKSTRLYYSFWHSVVAEYRPLTRLAVKLPPIDKKAEYEPSTKDIQTILKYSEGTRYHLVLSLCSIGLRRGEACAITSADLSTDNVLTIDKDLVLNPDNVHLLKYTTKTEASTRRILIPDGIAEELRAAGHAFSGNIHTINEYLHKAQDALGIPRFRLHVLRHFAAAFLLKNGFTVPQIEEYMGWEHGSSVMQKVYSYNLDPEERQKDIAGSLSALWKN